MQCKDIDDGIILEALERGNEIGVSVDDLLEVIQVDRKLLLAKMSKLIRRGLVDGCACGCRGDFTLT